VDGGDYFTVGEVLVIMSFRQRIVIAGVVGFCFSVVLFYWSYATHSSRLFWPQAVGFLICARYAVFMLLLRLTTH
jgi:hypothetical protein